MFTPEAGTEMCVLTKSRYFVRPSAVRWLPWAAPKATWPMMEPIEFLTWKLYVCGMWLFGWIVSFRLPIRYRFGL